ncbi:TPA: hypothetical protein MFL86_004564 [Klebsiella pneumoniae]|nr:hypothetical protein [Klebsiella pneumoniae]
MSEVKVNGSACCDRPGRAAFTVPAKDCRHSYGATPFRRVGCVHSHPFPW